MLKLFSERCRLLSSKCCSCKCLVIHNFTAFHWRKRQFIPGLLERDLASSLPTRPSSQASSMERKLDHPRGVCFRALLGFCDLSLPSHLKAHGPLSPGHKRPILSLAGTRRRPPVMSCIIHKEPMPTVTISLCSSLTNIVRVRAMVFSPLHWFLLTSCHSNHNAGFKHLHST